MTYSLKIGQTLDDRFKITDLIREGGMATVYEAIDCTTGSTVALKVPHLRYESDPGFYSRFQREEEIGRRLQHPAILRVLAVPEKSRPYIVMEHLEGRTLSQRLRADGPFPLSEATGIAIRVAEAIEYMHQCKVVHRDLTPQNIMLCEDHSIRIIDLGLAKGEGFRKITFPGFSSEMGSPHYISPEQVKGRPGDERSDIYGLGAILYHMVTGREPFKGSDPFAVMNARLVGDPWPPRKLNPLISPELEEIILHALERNPRDRHSSMEELAGELRFPGQVKLTGRHEHLKPPSAGRILWRRFRMFAWAILGVVGATGLLYVLSHSGRIRS
jgi:serine/threonine protein kinase